MYKGAKVGVVVPAYKEEAHIASVIDTMPEYVDRIVVVDDCSPDKTGEVARQAADKRTEVITLPENQGVGGGILTGHKRFMELGLDVSVVMAGDGQMDPNYLPQLLDPIVDHGYGFTKANRFFSSKSFEGMPKHRIFGNVLLTFLTKASSGYWNLVDPQNGYTAVTTEALQRLPLEKIHKRYDFENDMLIWLNIASVRAQDVSIPAVYGNETSTMKLTRVAPRILWTLIWGGWRRMWRKYILWDFSPIALLLIAGLFLTVFGVVVSLWATIWSLTNGVSASTGTWLLGVAPAIVGIQFMLQGLVLDIQATPK
ncbi:MAG: glycosyltransferase family 2 protein [Propionibacteriaceae bacterium]|nr:glycosyltransferase family 2 protein [Propionibacteriaceae bacterium]